MMAGKETALDEGVSNNLHVSVFLTNHSRKTLRFLQEASEKPVSCDPDEIT